MQYAGLHVPTEIAISGAKVINFLIISKLHAVFFLHKNIRKDSFGLLQARESVRIIRLRLTKSEHGSYESSHIGIAEEVSKCKPYEQKDYQDNSTYSYPEGSGFFGFFFHNDMF